MSKLKVKKSKPVQPEATPQPSAPQTASATNYENEPFPPELLLAHAEQEPARRTLSEYGAVIRELRDEKNFTFREIAHWLQKYNIMADHNAVYREYTTGMPPEVAEGEILADQQTEQEERP